MAYHWCQNLIANMKQHACNFSHIANEECRTTAHDADLIANDHDQPFQPSIHSHSHSHILHPYITIIHSRLHMLHPYSSPIHQQDEVTYNIYTWTDIINWPFGFGHPYMNRYNIYEPPQLLYENRVIVDTFAPLSVHQMHSVVSLPKEHPAQN